MTRYRLTALTPLLVGDGQKLAPIDYMVWKDQVNVLDQRRIFQLLARGARLDSYLAQIRRAEKLDFASWGGYAQNYASRRIPFEHPAAAQYYARTSAENLFIPTFAATPTGQLYVPGSAIKGALRTAMLAERASEGQWRQLAEQLNAAERPPRRPAESVEAAALGGRQSSRLRPLLVGDSGPVAPGGATRVFLLRTSTLLPRGSKLELGWKMSPRGAVESRRPGDSTPVFAEMAVPGTTFEGTFGDSFALSRPETVRALRWREGSTAQAALAAANAQAERMLAAQRQYAELATLPLVAQALDQLAERLAELKASGRGALICLGWGTGLLSKSASVDPKAEPFHQILRALPIYAQPLRSGLPFPKTRRVVFLADQPATLPGWAELAVEPA
jgi:CRISPR-associated protein Csm5